MTTRGQLNMLGIRSRSPVLNALTVDVTTFLTSAAAAAAIGTISGKTAGSTITITPADNVLALDGAQTGILRGVGAVTAGTYAYTFTETLAGALNSPRVTVINFTVSAPVVTLNALTVDVTAFLTNVAASSTIGNISGKTAGSTIAITPADNVLALNGGQNTVLRGVGAVAAGTVAYTFTETLAGASNSPRSTVINFTATDPATVPNFVPSASWNGTGGTGLTAAGVSFNVANPALDSPVVRLVSMDRCAITGSYDLLFSVHLAAHVGAYTIEVAWESAFQTVTQTPAPHNYVNPSDGNTYASAPCYRVTLDAAAARALVSSGEAIGVIRVTPADGGMAPRTWTFRYYPRTALNRVTATAGPQTAGAEYDRIIELYAGTGLDDPGKAYYDNTSVGGAFGKAASYLNTNSAANRLAGLRIMTNNGNYRFDDGFSTTLAARNAWTRVFKGTGVSKYMLGDGVNFPSFGAMQFDGYMFEAATIDLRQISPTFHTFHLTSGGGDLIGWSACEIYHGTSTFGVAAASGSGMTSLTLGDPPQSGFMSTQTIGVQLDAHFYECNIHDIAGPAILNTRGVIRNCTIQDVSGTLFKDCSALVHGGTFKRNAGLWSGLRTYWPMIQLVGPAGAQFMISGQSGNNRRLSLTQATATAWSQNGGVVDTTARRMAIPSSGGAAQGLVLFIKNAGSNVYAKAGDSTVTATTSDLTVASGQGGAFLTLTGTETHISIVSGGSPNSTITVLRSVFDTAVISTATAMSAIITAINGYSVTDPTWSASAITPAHVTDPVLNAFYMGADLNGFAYQTTPTPVNTTPAHGSPGVIYCWVDQHGDCIFTDTGTWENWCFEYCEFSQIRGSNIILINGGTVKDACLINHVCVTDDFQVYGLGPSGGTLAGNGKHFFIRNCSWAGGFCSLTTFNPDTYCGVDGSALYTLAGSPVNNNMRWSNSSLGKGVSAIPQGGVNVTNVKLANTQDDTARFKFIPTTTANESTPVDMRPFDATALQLVDGSICGRYDVNGSERIAA